MTETFLYPNVVLAEGIRLTDLDEWSIPVSPLVEKSRIYTSGFAELTVEPVVFQRAPLPIGGEDEGEACIVDHDSPKLTKLNFTLRLCGFPAVVFEKMIGATLVENPDVAGQFRGLVLKNSHRDCCPENLMIELFSRGADGCAADCAYTQWVLPLTRGWQLSSSFTFQNGETEFVLTGTGESNSNFYPSLPGATLPAYSALGVPNDPAPQDIPLNPSTGNPYLPDIFTSGEVDAVRAGGPMSVFCLPALPDGINDRGYMNHVALQVTPPVATPDIIICPGVIPGPAVCVVDLLVNDFAGTFPLDPASLVISNVSPGITVVPAIDGTVTVTGTFDGAFTFDYTVSDTMGNVSAPVTNAVSITGLGPPVPPVAVPDVAEGEVLVRRLPGPIEPLAVPDAGILNP